MPTKLNILDAVYEYRKRLALEFIKKYEEIEYVSKDK